MREYNPQIKIAQTTFAYHNTEMIELLDGRGSFLDARKFDEAREVTQ